MSKETLDRYEVGQRVRVSMKENWQFHGKYGVVKANNQGDVLPYNVLIDGRDSVICMSHESLEAVD